MTNYDILKEYEAHKTPVPSYEEYISLVNWKEDLTELCTVKERIIEKYENIDTWWKAECAELKEQNSQLKELLKECSPYVSRSAKSRMIKNSVGFKKDMKLLTKIDEVLNADKA